MSVHATVPSMLSMCLYMLQSQHVSVHATVPACVCTCYSPIMCLYMVQSQHVSTCYSPQYAGHVSVHATVPACVCTCYSASMCLYMLQSQYVSVHATVSACVYMLQSQHVSVHATVPACVYMLQSQHVCVHATVSACVCTCYSASMCLYMLQCQHVCVHATVPACVCTCYSLSMCLYMLQCQHVSVHATVSACVCTCYSASMLSITLSTLPSYAALLTRTPDTTAQSLSLVLEVGQSIVQSYLAGGRLDSQQLEQWLNLLIFLVSDRPDFSSLFHRLAEITILVLLRKKETATAVKRLKLWSQTSRLPARLQLIVSLSAGNCQEAMLSIQEMCAGEETRHCILALLVKLLGDGSVDEETLRQLLLALADRGFMGCVQLVRSYLYELWIWRNYLDCVLLFGAVCNCWKENCPF